MTDCWNLVGKAQKAVLNHFKRHGKYVFPWLFSSPRVNFQYCSDIMTHLPHTIMKMYWGLPKPCNREKNLDIFLNGIYEPSRKSISYSVFKLGPNIYCIAIRIISIYYIYINIRIYAHTWIFHMGWTIRGACTFGFKQHLLEDPEFMILEKTFGEALTRVSMEVSN